MTSNDKIRLAIVMMRKANGWKQQDLAQVLHVTQQAISNWERGKNLPDHSILETLKEKYHFQSYLEDIMNDEKTDAGSAVRLDQIDSLKTLENTVNTIFEHVALDNDYRLALKKMLELTLEMLIGYEVYYVPRCIKAEDADWSSLAWHLKNLVCGDDVPITRTDVRGAVQRKVFLYANSRLFGELGEDFENGETPSFQIGYTGYMCGNELLGVLPANENTLMTLYKASLLRLADYVDTL